MDKYNKDDIEKNNSENIDNNINYFKEENEKFYDNSYIEEKNEEEYVNYNEDKEVKNISYLKLLFIIITAFSLGGLSIFATQKIYFGHKSPLTSKVVVTKEDKVGEEITINAVSKAKDAVVSVVNYQKNPVNKLLPNIKEDTDEFKVTSSGSGVIYKKNGNDIYIVTNDHVINNAEKIDVILSNGTTVNAQLIGSDIWTDLAVLKINSDSVGVVMDFADSDKIAVGQTAIAIGSPLGVSLSNTVTKGIVSAIERQIPIDVDKDGIYDWYQTVLQTDAAINPGNSGGALVNNAGELIGINELKIINATQETTAEGIGFVIPSNEVKIITEQLEKNGKVQRAALGVQLAPISSLNPELLKETINFNGKKGVVIKNVSEGKSASKAGLKEYDVITKINDFEIQGIADLRKYLFEKTKIGDKVNLTYIRKGKEYNTELILGKL